MTKLKDMPLGSLVTWSKQALDQRWYTHPTQTGMVIGHHEFGHPDGPSWHIIHWLRDGTRESYVSREDLKYVLKTKGKK